VVERSPSSTAVSAARAWLLDRERWPWAIFSLLLLAIAVFHGWDHAAWVATDESPLIDADSPMHMLAVADIYSRWVGFDGFSIPYTAGTYPPAFHMLACYWFRLVEPSVLALRQVGVVFTVLGTLGVGVLAARALGRPVGLAAAAAAWTFPLCWTERAEVQLDLPMAGAVALAFAFLPTPRRPGTRWLAVAAGLGMNLALLTKQAMLPIAAAALGWLALRAVVLWWLARRRGDAADARSHLIDVGVTLGVVAVVCVPHYLLAWGAIRGAMTHIYDVAPPLQGDAMWAAKLGLLGWFTQRFMQAPHLIALILGLACLPFLRGRALMTPVLFGLAGGLVQFLHFPNPHERHFVALAPLVLLLGLAPLGLLRKAWWRQGLRWALALVVVVWGLGFSWSWRTGTAPWGGPAMRLTGHEFGHFEQLHSSSEAWRWLVTRPDRFYTAAPRAERTSWPQEDVVLALSELLGPPGPQEQLYRDLTRDPSAPTVLVLNGLPPDTSMTAYAGIMQEFRWRFLGMSSGDLEPWIRELQAGSQPPARLLLLSCEPEGSDGPHVADSAPALGFELLRSWRGATVEGGPVQAITLWERVGYQSPSGPP